MNIILHLLAFGISYLFGVLAFSNVIYPLFIAPSLYLKLKAENTINTVPLYTFIIGPITSIASISLLIALINYFAPNLLITVTLGLIVALIMVLCGCEKQRKSLWLDFISSWSRYINYSVIETSNQQYTNIGIHGLNHIASEFLSSLSLARYMSFYNEKKFLPYDKRLIKCAIIHAYKNRLGALSPSSSEPSKLAWIEALMFLTRFQAEVKDHKNEESSWVGEIIDDEEWQKLRLNPEFNSVPSEQWSSLINHIILKIKSLKPGNYHGLEQKSLKEFQGYLKELN